MKDKILNLIIGILIGSIITSAGFVIYIKASNKGRMNDFREPPQMNQSQNLDQNRGTPPELSNGGKKSDNQKNEQKPSENQNNEQKPSENQKNESKQSNT